MRVTAIDPLIEEIEEIPRHIVGGKEFIEFQLVLQAINRKKKKEPNLDSKCGSCVYAGKGSTKYRIKCKNKNVVEKDKARTNLGCKWYNCL